MRDENSISLYDLIHICFASFIKAKKKFIEQQNIIQKTALAEGENLKSADALRQNVRAVELARVTVERESKELNALQEDLARHMGKKPKTS